MEEVQTFNKIINDFYIEVQLIKGNPNELSFILVENRREQCFELKFGDSSMPLQLRAIFKNVKELYQYLYYFQDNREYFDIFPQGSLKIVKQQEENGTIGVRTLQLRTYPVKVRDSGLQTENFIEQQFCRNEAKIEAYTNQATEDNIDLEGNQRYRVADKLYQSFLPPIPNKSPRDINQLCQTALLMIQQGNSQDRIARALKIKHLTVRKMMMQVKLYGTVYPPIRQQQLYNGYHQNVYDPRMKQNNEYINFQQSQEEYYHINQTQQQTWPEAPPRQLGPVTPNMKMHGDGVREIKKLLFVLVKEGKMQSLDEMRNFLLERNIDRSLSSIYRYISSIKAQHPEFQGRNYTMYRKQLENIVTTKTAGKNAVSKGNEQKADQN